MKTTANGISMNYEIKGKGTNLVLIHGATANLETWHHQIPVFSRYYRVVAYDIRGSGSSEIGEGDYSIPLFTEDAYQLMKALKVDKAIFLGHSMGGRIALELAILHPELVKALILANSPAFLPPPTGEALKGRQVMMELLEKGDIKTFAASMTASSFSPEFKLKNPAIIKRSIKVKLKNKPEGIARLMRALFNNPAAPPDFSKVKCPVLIIVGENDAHMGTEQGSQTQAAIAGSKLVMLPTGHASAVELPKKFNSAVLEFLSGIK